jgi:Actinobacteria/chloroflexi VLRF1 release factor
VDILGKKKLEERVRDLELRLTELKNENENLNRTLEKRDEKIRKLSHAYQDVSIALKAAEQKYATQLTKVETSLNESAPASINLRPREMERLLSRLECIKSPANDLITAQSRTTVDLPADSSQLAKSLKSSRGWIFLQCPQLFSLLLNPPLPIEEDFTTIAGSFELGLLREMLDTPLLVVSLHAGESFLGLALSKDKFQAKELIRSMVKEKHSKGGWSQKRFERLREEDIKSHIGIVIEKLKEFINNYRLIAKMVVVGGDPILINQVLPFIDLPVIEKRFEKYDEKELDHLLDDIYSFACYRL